MSIFFSPFSSYGRVYAADPYNHTLTPAATYSVGAMVRLSSTINLWLLGKRGVCLFIACITPPQFYTFPVVVLNLSVQLLLSDTRLPMTKKQGLRFQRPHCPG